MIKLTLLKEEEVVVEMEVDSILVGVDLILQQDMALKSNTPLLTGENNPTVILLTTKMAKKIKHLSYVKYIENTTTLPLNVGVVFELLLIL